MKSFILVYVAFIFVFIGVFLISFSNVDGVCIECAVRYGYYWYIENSGWFFWNGVVFELIGCVIFIYWVVGSW